MNQHELKEKTNYLRGFLISNPDNPDVQFVGIQQAYKIFGHCINSLISEEFNSNPEEYLNLAALSVQVLRNGCAFGAHAQDFIVALPDFFTGMRSLLSSGNPFVAKYGALPNCDKFKTTCWQTIGNLCVGNMNTMSIVWGNMGECLLKELETVSPFTDIQIMIIYNMFKAGELRSYDSKLFLLLLQTLDCEVKEQKGGLKFEFLHIFLEYFLTKYPQIVELYKTLPEDQRILVLHYIGDYIRNGSRDGPLPKSLLSHITDEFKRNANYVRRAVQIYICGIQPREVVALLEIISYATGTEMYEMSFMNDQSLFVYIGNLLQILDRVGKTSANIFSPKQKLEEVAPNSTEQADFEKEMSYNFKGMLVRTMANLAYRNKKNREYAGRSGFLYTVLNIANVDARNPLIREWAILAIRNMCEGCPRNQEIIAHLRNVGDAPNETLKELNLDLGALRIQPSE